MPTDGNPRAPRLGRGEGQWSLPTVPRPATEERLSNRGRRQGSPNM